MSSASRTTINPPLIGAAVAANADQLGEPAPQADRLPETAKSIEASGGWDAYDVWRRCIKDARARRERRESD